MVQLQYIENASKDDEDHNLVYWAKLFNATTWEEFRALAKGNPVIEEVGNLMLHMNVDETTRSLLEGQKKYREQFASQYTAGYTDAEEKYEPIITRLSEQNSDLLNHIAIKNAALVEKDAALAEKDAALVNNEATIADMAAIINRLQAELDKYKK